MAFTSQGSIGTGVRTSAGTSTTITTSALANAGDLVLVWIAKDNSSTTDANNNEVTNVVDSAGNQYLEADEYTNTAGGVANDGATASLWYCKLTYNLPSSGTITVTHSSVTDVALAAWRFTTTVGSVGIKTKATPVLDDATAHGTSISISSLSPSKEYLFVRATAIEDEALTTDTATSNYTPCSHLPSTTTGGNAVNIFVAGEFHIVSGTGSTSNPTYTTAASTQGVTLFVAFEEVTVSHATSGALAATSGTVIAGTARHNIPHPSSGALANTGAAIAGTAQHKVRHWTSGALAPSDASVIVGAAARMRAHPSSGVLAGGDSTIAGASARMRAHPSSGDLSPAGAAIAGAASRGSGVTAVVSGTATETIDEADVRAGGKTIVITLTGETWIPA